MSEQVTNGQAAVVAAPVRTPLQFEAADFDALYRMAEMLSRSGLLPEPLRNKPADVAIIMLQGRELGLQPMQSINGIDVIQGKPNISPALMAAMVRANPACEYLSLVESTERGATWTTKRKGSPKPVTMSYTLEMAQRAGLIGKDNYRKNPEAMYIARGLGRICRAEYQDIIKGTYVKGEIPGDPTIEPDLPGEANEPAAASVTVVEAAPRKPETLDEIVDQEKAEKRRRATKHKTESAGAAVAQAAEAPSPPAAAPANPTEVPPAPPAVPAAPAAPSQAAAQAAPAARKDWLNEEKLINAFLGAVVELPPEGIATILRFHGATRGHVDGCLGLARDPGKQAALLIALKEAGQRQRAGL